MQVTLDIHTVTGSKPFQPQQVHLRLTSQQSGAAAFFAGKPAKDVPSKFTFSVTSAGIDKQMLGPQVGVIGPRVGFLLHFVCLGCVVPMAAQ